jgi:uncharacterized protein (DUF2062 family)
MDEAVAKLSAADLNLLSERWAHILWNPVAEQMITGALIVGEANLLELANVPVRNRQSHKRLLKLRESIQTLARASATGAAEGTE